MSAKQRSHFLVQMRICCTSSWNNTSRFRTAVHVCRLLPSTSGSQQHIRCSNHVAMAPEWRVKLQTSLEKNKKLPYGKYYQLATLRPDGRPANRTVVHRGFYGESGITIVTDHRSDKIMEVAKNPWGEAAWYFEDSREQYRIGGKITVIGYEHTDEGLLKERQRTWNMLSPGGRGQFLYPDPGKPRSDEDEDKFKQEAPPPKSEPSKNFCLLILDADEVDYLHLKQNIRIEYKSSQADDGSRQWTGVSVNP